MRRRASCLLQALPACWLFPQHRPLPAVAFPVCDLPVKVPAPIKPVPTHFMGVLIKRYLPRNFTFINWIVSFFLKQRYLLPRQGTYGSFRPKCMAQIYKKHASASPQGHICQTREKMINKREPSETWALGPWPLALSASLQGKAGADRNPPEGRVSLSCGCQLKSACWSLR